MKAVTPEAVRAVARVVIRNDRLNFAVVGPYRDEKIFKKIVKIIIMEKNEQFGNFMGEFMADRGLFGVRRCDLFGPSDRVGAFFRRSLFRPVLRGSWIVSNAAFTCRAVWAS